MMDNMTVFDLEELELAYVCARASSWRDRPDDGSRLPQWQPVSHAANSIAPRTAGSYRRPHTNNYRVVVAIFACPPARLAPII